MPDEDLSREIEDLIAVSYVMSRILDEIAPEGEPEPPSTTMTNGTSHLRSEMTASKLYDNSQLIFDTYIVKPCDVISDAAIYDSISNADSLDEFLRLEQQCLGRDAGSFSRAAHSPATAGYADGKSPAPSQGHHNSDKPLQSDVATILSLVQSNDGPDGNMEIEVIVGEYETVTTEIGTPKEPVQIQQPKIEERRKEVSVEKQSQLGVERDRNSRSVSIGARGLLMRLEEENEELAEQVEVLERMNERTTKKLKDCEEKFSRLEQEKTVQQKSEEGKTAGHEALISQLKSEISARDKLLKVLAEERKSAVATVEELRGELSDTQSTSQLDAANISELETKVEGLEKELADRDDKLQTTQTNLDALASDEPTVAEMVIIKSYLHPEMTKRAISVVRDAFELRGLRGDAAALHVSNEFDTLYGPHWQAVLYRENGHGCLVYHNNNCYICFKLGNFHFILFRY